MTALSVLTAHQNAARRQTVLDTTALGLGPTLLAAAFGWRLFGSAGLVAAGVIGLVILTLVAAYRARRFDRGWLVGTLDARIPRFEDSSALLFADKASLTGLRALQRDRLEARVTEARDVDVRPDWSGRSIAWAWGVTLILTTFVLLWPDADHAASPAEPAPAPSAAAATAVTSIRLRITPPAYTGVPTREQTTLDARVPEGSRIDWVIGFAPAPPSAGLTFPEGTPVPLVRDGDVWGGAMTVERSLLYRIEAEGLARQRLSRLDAIPDTPPTVTLVDPVSQLVLVTSGQTRWTPVFEASDDYGVSDDATLRITVTQGDGENITFEQRSISLRGRGEARRLRFSTTLDLAQEGMAPGSDLIVQLVVSDNRAGGPQAVEGPSVILRWPVDLVMADGLDGMAVDVLPVYFRSQRQIIIDTEALIAERPRLERAPFMNRANSLGADQAQLRLRYGQFMGEEAEGGGNGGGIALPTDDAPPARPVLPTDDTPSPTARGEVQDADDHDHDGHDEDGETAGFGSAVDALNEFGHAHDSGDAATLFDPPTRSTLGQALDAMWSSERALRQGRPEEALPFAYQALELLKQAQQATRIFLARTGPDLPPIDLSRRLTGKREDIVAETAEPPQPPSADTAAVDAWRALEERPGRAPPLGLGALERWVRGKAGRLPDPLALTAAIDTVRNEPDCLDCRRRLRALLWTAMDRPPVSVPRREAPGRRGQRYLDALR